jgi:hypothetical protein
MGCLELKSNFKGCLDSSCGRGKSFFSVNLPLDFNGSFSLSSEEWGNSWVGNLRLAVITLRSGF